MRLPTLAALASLAAIAAADKFEIFTTCPWVGPCDSWGWWYTCCGRYYVIANDGCWYGNLGVPALNTLCMDWNNRRGHFYFDGQPKRCISQTSEWPENGGQRQNWDEVPCTW